MSRKANNSSKRSAKSPAAMQQYSAVITNCAANAHKTAQPGIIASIMTQLVQAKINKAPVTVAHILNTLQQQFPTRTKQAMSITVRAQLSRLPKQRGFAITKTRVGRVVTYVAS